MKWGWLLFLGAVVLAMGETARRILTTGFRQGEPFPLELQSIGGNFYLARVAAPAFLAMQQKAAESGVRLQVNSAFRDNGAQAELRQKYDAGEGPIAAKPGFSNHQAGLAVDIETAGGTNPAFHWLTGNAHLFGFHRTVASEPWHWEYTEPWAQEGLEQQTEEAPS